MMDTFVNENHKKLLETIVNNFINDSLSNEYSREHFYISEAEVSELIKLTVSHYTSKIHPPFNQLESLIKLNQIGLALFLIGKDLQDRVYEKLKQYKIEKKDMTIQFFEDSSFFSSCILKLFDEPVDNFLDDEELKELIKGYSSTEKPRIYKAFDRFEWVTPPLKVNTILFSGSIPNFDYRAYIQFWKQSSNLNKEVSDFYKSNISDGDCWCQGKFRDFYEMDKTLSEYRSEDHDEHKKIFTLEHAFIYNLLKDVKQEHFEPALVLKDSFPGFVEGFIRKFYSTDLSLKVSSVVKDYMYDNLSRKAAHQERKREWEDYKKEREAKEKEIHLTKLKKVEEQEKEQRKQDVDFFVLVSKVIILISLLAILPLPYAFYKILRICIFAYSIFTYNQFEKHSILNGLTKKKTISLLILFGIIFNPIIPIHLDKATWAILNVLFAIFSGWLFRKARSKGVSSE